MIPTVTQQLRAMRVRLEETVVPALRDDAGFAREQALLMMATLDWLTDTHEHEYRYQVTENAEYRAVVRELASDDAEARTVLDRPAPSPADVAVPLADVAEQNRLLKDIVARAHAAAVQDPATRGRAHDLVAAVARRQRDRELSWYRMTGFPGARSGIADVLGAS
ncbi:hypothetical protein Acsp06_43290 [Actinomycetospora sp. NBRC 106375]|uniref:hypothetical protein n=1 Tax=Actinomycetospora sp. NBRC 106375 TaxID=3032207 RepID=UPI0024A22573|nr:hypothetical protein [Actinomycetospora sp. NBRC 106375]GLZ48144.1 hypothetical protein Acsp06_43290 [Actinomycetospora sp. NBRC 106375]